MSAKKKSSYSAFVHRLICLLMSLHIINVSIDAPDQYGYTSLLSTQADLSVNDIESYTELLLEEGLGMDNAIPEQDEPDEEALLVKLKQDYFFAQAFVFSVLLPRVQFESPRFYPLKPIYLPAPVADVISPPPQVAAS
jgi:hypothetical protein